LGTGCGLENRIVEVSALILDGLFIDQLVIELLLLEDQGFDLDQGLIIDGLGCIQPKLGL